MKFGEMLKTVTGGVVACIAGGIGLFGCVHGNVSDPAVYYGPEPVSEEKPVADASVSTEAASRESSPETHESLADPSADSGNPEEEAISGDPGTDKSSYGAEELKKCDSYAEDNRKFLQCIDAYRRNRVVMQEKRKAVYGPPEFFQTRGEKAVEESAVKYSDAEKACCEDAGAAGSDGFESCVEAYRTKDQCGSDDVRPAEDEVIAIYGVPDDFS